VLAQSFKVRIDGREFEVELRRENDLNIAIIEGRRYEVSGSNSGDTMVRESGSLKHHRVVLDGLARPAHVGVNGASFAVEVSTQQEAALEAALSTSAGGGSAGDLVSPMPGRIVRVLVSEGDEVDAGSPLVIVEAMKMENELQAPISGRVRSLTAKEGATVDAGVVLCVVETHADAPS
jgi:biotin carboxyl carrier protein